MKGKLAASPELSKPREFQWTPKHQQAFDALKEALVIAPVLGYPDFNREFMLELMFLCKVWEQFYPNKIILGSSM